MCKSDLRAACGILFYFYHDTWNLTNGGWEHICEMDSTNSDTI